MSASCPPSSCDRCPSRPGTLERLGLELGRWDRVVALAGNPNTGKSTVFNRLTGLRQHTGNWPGKTIARAEGGFAYQKTRYKLVDLPGTYSLLSATPDEEVARDFILFGRPDVTVIVTDATALARNLNLTLQVLQLTSRAVVCLNLMDEARAHGLEIDPRGLAADLGVPVVPCSAREGEGLDRLVEEIAAVSADPDHCRPYQLRLRVPGLPEALHEVESSLAQRFPGLPQRRWIALRLLEGDRDIARRVADGTIGQIAEDSASTLLQGKARAA